MILKNFTNKTSSINTWKLSKTSFIYLNLQQVSYFTSGNYKYINYVFDDLHISIKDVLSMITICETADSKLLARVVYF